MKPYHVRVLQPALLETWVEVKAESKAEACRRVDEERLWEGQEWKLSDLSDEPVEYPLEENCEEDTQ